MEVAMLLLNALLVVSLCEPRLKAGDRVDTDISV